MLAEHYGCTLVAAKARINEETYSLFRPASWFKRHGVKRCKDHEWVTEYRAMIAAATKVLPDPGDLAACSGKWRRGIGLAETINRLEAQIMRVVEDRLVTHWGADLML